LGTPNGEALLAALKASRTTAAAPRLRMMAANAVAVPPGQQKSA
jgi:urease beta subunit